MAFAPDMRGHPTETQKVAMRPNSKINRVDDAYERLKREILQNRMPPGFQATEPEVAIRLNMSRTPVREALIRLRAEGLVELIPRRGMRVLPIARSDMRDIYQLLTVLEPEAAADVAREGLDNEQATVLEAATTEMEQALHDEDLDTWAAADDRFHRILLGYNRNDRLTAFVNTLFDQAHRARMVTLRLRDVPWKSTEDHRDILKALSDGNPSRTRKLFRNHRERAAAELLKVLEQSRLSQL
ncbi:MAG: GntR family transcriptional regulator [Pseudomonadota bacterium]